MNLKDIAKEVIDDFEGQTFHSREESHRWLRDRITLELQCLRLKIYNASIKVAKEHFERKRLCVFSDHNDVRCPGCEAMRDEAAVIGSQIENLKCRDGMES